MDLVLDTNIYRNLVRSLSDDEVSALLFTIRQRCKENDIKLLFPINSAMELISHYDDERDIERTECRKALRLLVNLSTTFTSTNLNVDFIPGLNGILERYIDQNADTHSIVYATVITAAQKLVGNTRIEAGDNMEHDVRTIREQIEFEKTEIRDNYRNYLELINDGQADWTYFHDKSKKAEREEFFAKLRNGTFSFLVAQSMFDRAHNLVGKAINKNQKYFDDLIVFMQEFAPALLMNELLLQNIGHGTAAIEAVADKRWNTIIDISLIFGALFNPSKRDTRLVTEERNIHEAYNICGMQEKIITLLSFKQLMHLT